MPSTDAVRAGERVDASGEAAAPAAPTPPPSRRSLGVVIGRNEGERVVRAVVLASQQMATVTYVDSASSDGSPEAVRDLGVPVIAMPPDRLGAARARTAGVADLLARHPDAEFIQFIDGDCLLEPGWIRDAEAAMDRDAHVGAVVGRRTEEFADESPWIALCDAEWVLPAGTTDSLGGGDALIRAAALHQAGGWPETMAAGEDLVMSHRLTSAGWRIERLDRPMVLHDIGIRSLGQYWTRARRSGLAYAAAAAETAGGPGKRWMRRAMGMCVYGLLLPLLVPILAIVFFPHGLLALLVVLLLPARQFAHRLRMGHGPGNALRHALLINVQKVAGALGVVQWAMRARRSSEVQLIEYKSAQATSTAPAATDHSEPR